MPTEFQKRAARNRATVRAAAARAAAERRRAEVEQLQAIYGDRTGHGAAFEIERVEVGARPAGGLFIENTPARDVRVHVVASRASRAVTGRRGPCRV